MGRGHQLDPGTKRRSGGYIASSPSGPGATNPRGKKLEYKHEARKRKAKDPGVRGSARANQTFYDAMFKRQQRFPLSPAAKEAHNKMRNHVMKQIGNNRLHNSK